MGKTTIVVLRIVIAGGAAGFHWRCRRSSCRCCGSTSQRMSCGGRIVLVSLAVLGVGTLQVFGVCVWMLLTRVRRGSIFAESSFRYVNVIIGAILVAAALTWILAALLAPGSTAPGVVALIGGAGGRARRDGAARGRHEGAAAAGDR